jgi:hypothetical protein
MLREGPGMGNILEGDGFGSVRAAMRDGGPVGARRTDLVGRAAGAAL